MDEKYVLVPGDYLYVAGSARLEDLKPLGRMYGRMVGFDSYGELKQFVESAGGATIAVSRKSGKFSLVSSLPPEDELDRAFGTTEDEQHLWSAPPSDQPPEGIDPVSISAILRDYVRSGGSRETLRSIVESL